MSEPTTEQITEPTPEPAPEAEPTNRDVKDSELFKKVTSELAQLKAEKEELEASEATAKKEAEIARLKESNDFEAALKLQQDEIEAVKKKHAAELQSRDLKLGLSKAGFSSRGIDLLSSEYTEGSIDDYIKTVAADEGNKILMTGGRQVLEPPAGAAVTGAKITTIEQAREASKSDDPERRKHGRSWLESHYKEKYS